MARVKLQFDGVSTGARRAALETRAAVKGVGDQADRDTKRISLMGPALRRTLALATVGLTLFAAASALAFKKSIDAASNLTEQINKARVVFRGAEKEVIAWSETTSRSIGISQRAALEFSGTFGNMLVPMGFARKEAAQMSMQLVQLAADMASFNNASPEEVLEAIRAGLAGETEPLRRFGIFLSEARIQQIALNEGLVEGKEKLTAAGKASAIYRIILKDTADAQGDFARTSDALANSQRTTRAVLEDVAARLGKVFLPAVTSASNALNDWLQDESNIRMLERWAEALEEGVGDALNRIAGWVGDNREEIVTFFREMAEFAGDAAGATKDLAVAADDVAEAVGGWDEAFKLVITGALALKLSKILTLLGGGAGATKGAGILGTLTRLKTFGIISIPFTLDFIDRKSGGKLADVNDWIFQNITRPISEAAGLKVVKDKPAASPATTGPGGAVADPRGGAVGSLSPQSGGAGGGVSFTTGVTKPRSHVVAFVARVAAVYGAPLNINSGFRPGSIVKGTNNPSQHGTGDAADIGPYYGSQLTEIGQAALIAAGMPEAQAYRHGSFVGTVNGVNILFNTNVGGNHFNHCHVGLRSLPAAEKSGPQTVGPVTDTTAVTSTAAPATADPADVKTAQGTARFINQHLESIASPTLRARIRQRGLAIAAVLADVTDPKEFARAKRNLAALERDFKNAVELTAATKQAQATARNISSALGNMPETLQRELRPKVEKLNRELGNVTSKRQLDRIKKDLEGIQGAIQAAVDKMVETVERKRDAFGAAFGVVADKALQVFDAKTDELIRKARAKVGDELLGEGELGVAGRALAEFRAARATADRARSRAEALGAAETPEERARLEAEHALEDQEAALKQAADAEQRALDLALAAERARIQDERAILKERFRARYDEIVRSFQQEEITAEEARNRMLALLADPEFAADFAEAGKLIGDAFALSFAAALEGVAAAVRALRGAIQGVADATGQPMPGETNAERALRLRSEALNMKYGLGFAGGGRVPGRYVGRADTVMARLTPGEEIIDRSTAEQLRRFLAGGGAGSPTLAGNVYVWSDDREVARFFRRLVDGAPPTVGYDSER